MISKKEKQFMFEVELNWIEKNTGVLSARDAGGCVYVSAPEAFGGEGKSWSPEHLFLGSISSCFMNTFLFFAKNEKLPLKKFECGVIGRIDFVDGRFRFNGIDLFPKITVADEQFRQQSIDDLLEKARQYCIITGSVNTPVYYHNKVLIETHVSSNKF